MTAGAFRGQIEVCPPFLVNRLMDCFEDVRLLAPDGAADGLKALELLNQYRKNAATQMASTLPFSLQMWVALAALDTAMRDVTQFEFDLRVHLSGPMLSEILDRFTGTRKQRPSADPAKGVAKRSKLTDRKLSRVTAEFLIEAQEPMMVFPSLLERDKAVQSWKIGGPLEGETNATYMARASLVSSADLALYERAMWLLQRERDEPAAFLSELVDSAAQSERSRGHVPGETEKYDRIQIHEIGLREGWTSAKPGTRRRAEIVKTVIQELSLKEACEGSDGTGNTSYESIERHVRRILNKLQPNDDSGTGDPKTCA